LTVKDVNRLKRAATAAEEAVATAAREYQAAATAAAAAAKNAETNVSSQVRITFLVVF
jgi:hypothetical protein